MATNKGNTTCSCCLSCVFSAKSGSYSPKSSEDVSPPPVPPKTGKRLHLSSFGCGTTYELDKEFEERLTRPSRTGKVVSLVSFDIPKYNLKDE
nr:L [Miniopterus schreibersii picornavirus 1] [mischivirus A1]